MDCTGEDRLIEVSKEKSRMVFMIDRVVLGIAEWIAHRRGWSPINQRVLLSIDESRDANLCGRTLRGRITNTSPDTRGLEAKALIALDEPLNYRGHYAREITTLRSEPERQWHVLKRLVVGPARVHLIDCDTTHHDSMIAVGSMRLDSRAR